MRIDLHVHTSPRSPCSNINPVELIQEANRIGLDGFCLTEHQVMWDWDEVVGLAGDEGIRIFRGNEITTAQGDVLVFGLERNVQGIITIQELHQIVKSAGGFSIAAHPFRGFLLFGFGMLQMNVNDAFENPTLSQVHAVEICNGKVTDEENDFAKQVAEALGLIKVGGSDAHSREAVGTCVTNFEAVIKNERDLITAIMNQGFSLERCK